MVQVLFCQACGKSVVVQQRSQVTQHLSGSKHIAAIARLKQKDGPGKQSVIGESSATKLFLRTFHICHFCDRSVQSICVRRHTDF
jgi:hypothetical protein